MFARIYKKHKKICMVLGGLLLSILLVLYLYLLFLPGVWLRNSFLIHRDNGYFTCADIHANYKMRITSTDNQTNILFSVNAKSKQYKIINEKNLINIYEDDNLVFQGSAHRMGDSFWLVDKDVSFEEYFQTSLEQETFSQVTPVDEDLFPSYSWLYGLSVMEKYETRGEPSILLIIVLTLLILVLDIAFPDLFFQLKYGLAVDGGEPSDWYRRSQIIGRYILVVFIIAFMIVSLILR